MLLLTLSQCFLQLLTAITKMHRDHIAIKVMKRFSEMLLFIYVIAMPPGLGQYWDLLCQPRKCVPCPEKLGV